MRAVLEGVDFNDPAVPLLANADAREITTADDARNELVEHLTKGVDWVGAVERMTAAGVTTFVEVGPGRVLTGLIKRIAPDAEAVAARRRRRDRASSTYPSPLPHPSSPGGFTERAQTRLRPPRRRHRPGRHQPRRQRRPNRVGQPDARRVGPRRADQVRRQPLRAQVGRRGQGLQRNRLDGSEARPADRVERRTSGLPPRSRRWPTPASRSPTPTARRSGSSSARAPAARG